MVIAERELAAENRGPRMARAGFVVVAVLATLALLLNIFRPNSYQRINLTFFSTELIVSVGLVFLTFTEWFRSRWDWVVLLVCFVLFTVMATVSTSVGYFRDVMTGLLLMQMGTAAFLPWRPSRQAILGAGTLGVVGVFTLFAGRPGGEVLGYWVVLIIGAMIGQVACVASYRYRLELARRLGTVIAGRERLAGEVQEREKVIATLRETQKALMVSREVALAASRVRSEFLSSMSHEIRTPMNSVLGMAELLGETELDAEQRRYLNLIQANGETLLELINSILDLARIESGRLNLAAGEFDPRELVEQVLDALAVAAFEKGLELVARVSLEVPRRVVGDAFRLRQVLTNLIGNAIKFTERGQVVVRLDRDPDFRAASALRFTVIDTGIGIAADKMKMIFEPFRQADSSNTRGYGGSGLGLAIASRLAGLMHGELTAESEPGKGSTFRFAVPLESAAKDADEAQTSSVLQGTSVLVVDDNAEVRTALREMLTHMGAEVEECESGYETIRRLQQERNGDARRMIVLLDGSLPDLSRVQIIETMSSSAIQPSRIIMMLRTTDLTIDLAELRAAGLGTYLTKPIKLADLRAVCLAIIGKPTLPAHRAPVSENLAPEFKRPARLLIADDVAVNRTLIHDMLRNAPFVIDDAVDGQDAFAKVVAGHYDLVLMDMQMPILDGYDAVAAIRKWERGEGRGRLPIIALTASALETDIKRATEAGCDLHLAKPFRRRDLMKLLAQQLPTLPSADYESGLAARNREAAH